MNDLFGAENQQKKQKKKIDGSVSQGYHVTRSRSMQKRVQSK
jgi:hypothetical protein